MRPKMKVMALTALLLLSLLTVSDASGRSRRRNPNRRRSQSSEQDRDEEWMQMIKTNPFPDSCSQDIDNKMSMRLCILENLWSEQMPLNRRRYMSNKYRFLNDLNKLVPMRNDTSPDPQDCLINQRTRVRRVPYDCYSTKFGDWEPKETYMDPFVQEIGNELRFTFDYVLYDETFNTRIEDKFWYLMLYLKKVVMENPNPYTISKIVNEDCKAKLVIEENLKKVPESLREKKTEMINDIRTILQSFMDLKSLVETLVQLKSKSDPNVKINMKA